MNNVLASLVFFENPAEICDILFLVIQEKQNGIDKSRFDDENFAIYHKLIEHKCITPTQNLKRII